MKSLIQFLFCFFFVSFLLAQETAFNPSHQKRNTQLRQAQDPRSSFIDSAQQNKFVREQQTNLSRSALQQSSQSPKSMHKISGSGLDTAWVRHYGSGLKLAGPSVATATAVDAFGNVYVTGNSYGSGTGYDYATIKYNSNGDTLWVRRYNGPGNSDDYAHSLAVDAFGNVYVTGRSDGSGTDYDYATIKYNSNGDMLWVRRYNGPGNGSDWVRSLAVDGSGNVYVTGQSHGACATIKYNSNGDTLWVRRYNGPENSSAWANSLAVDGIGNVYVTGSSYGSGTYNDYATIKYNSNGDTLWVRRYNGPGNSSDGAISLAVDGIGNVYVTGSSYSGTASDYSDYATIKYNSNGDTLWVRRYDAGNSNDDAISLAVDGIGNVYVTGSSSDDYATIKYNTNGDTLWVRRYNGPGNSSDRASSLAVDGIGNVYVTGSSNESGTSPRLFDYATIKYNSNGNTLWVRRYERSTGRSYGYGASSLAVDGSGNVYVSGSTYGSDTYSCYATIKYNSNGDTLWERRYNGPGNSDDHAFSLAVDGSGNVYVTGTSYGSGTSYDYATIKYNSNGDTLWVRRYNGPGNSDDHASSLAVDGSGNVYVTGSSGSYQNSDYATIKYNSHGDTLWVRRYNGPGNSNDYASSLAVDGSGNVYVSGYSYESGTPSDYTTIKYNSNGDTLWVRRYNGPGYSYDYARSLTVDGSGNVYVSGYSYESGTSSDYSDYATIKYNSNGDTLWVRRYNGPGNSYDEASSLAVDGIGNVYVSGSSHGSGTSCDYATIKYKSNGETLWVRRYDAGNGNDYAKSLAVDGIGNVYVSGSSYGSDTFSWYATIKYSNAGNEEWVAQYLYGARYNEPVCIKVDPSGKVYVGGTSTFGSQNVYTVIKYIQTPNSVKEIENTVPTTFVLEQNYPNPFNPSTVISYQLPVNSKVSLKIYDLLGREIATLVNEVQSAGWKEVVWNAAGVSSGIYFYKITANNFNDVKKCLVIK